MAPFSWELRRASLPKRGCCLVERTRGRKAEFWPLAFVVADVEIEILVFFFVFLEEGVGIIVANVLDILDVFDLGDFLFSRFAGFFGVGIFERDDLGLIGGRNHRSDLDFFVFLVLLFFGLGAALTDDVLLEIGARVGLPRVRRDDRIFV